MINQRDGVIAELLRSEACTLWASGWLAFQHIATKAFPSLDFDLQVPNEEEAEEFVYDDEVDPEVLSDTPSSAPLPSEAEIPAEAGSSSHPPPPPPFRLLGLCLMQRTAWKLALLKLLVALPPTSRPLCIIFAYSG